MIAWPPALVAIAVTLGALGYRVLMRWLDLRRLTQLERLDAVEAGIKRIEEAHARLSARFDEATR